MWHGILVDVGFRDEKITDSVRIIGRASGGHWTLYKIEVKDEDLDKLVRIIQETMKDHFYSHFYNEKGEMIVVFTDKVFKMTQDKKTWDPAIKHGLKKEIPIEQLDFYPYRFEDETY